LVKEDFGLFAFALGIAAIAGQAVQFEPKRGLVTRKEGRPALAKAYLKTGAYLGAALTVAMLGMGVPLLPRMGLGLGLLWFAAFPVLEGLRSAPLALAEIEGRFAPLARVEIGAALVQVGAACGLAFAGFGVLSLVVGFVLGASLRTFGAWMVAKPWTWEGQAGPAEYTAVKKMGVPLLLTGFLMAFYWKIDDVLVASLLGAGAAGSYWLAFQLPHALMQVTDSLGRVSLSMMAGGEGWAARRRVFALSVRASFALLGSACLVGLVHGDAMIRFLFGPSWAPAVPVFQVFLVFVLLRGSIRHWADVASVAGRNDLIVKSSIVLALAVPILGSLFALAWGITGMALGVFVAWALPAPFYLSWALRRCGYSIFDLSQAGLMAFVPALGLGFLGRAFWPGSPTSGMFTIGASQLLLFWGLLRAFDPELLRIFFEALTRKAVPPPTLTQVPDPALPLPSPQSSPCPGLRIHILQWGAMGDTHACLASLAASEGVQFEVYVLDNASPDFDEKEWKTLVQAFPQFHFERSPQNLGFAAGHNLLLTQALDAYGRGQISPYTLLLNNDVRVNRDTLCQLLTVASERSAAAVGALNRLPEEAGLAPSGGSMVRPQMVYQDASIPALESGEEAFPVETLCGSTLLLDLRWLSRVGLLDPAYFCVAEETDLCLRLHQAGAPLFLAPRAEVIHALSASTSKKLHLYYRFRNRLRLARSQGCVGPAFWIFYLSEVTARIVLYSALGRIDNAMGVFLGLRDALRGRYGKAPFQMG
jgi:GT2 family glycosyltransferase/O-antigen/teichoic acid export membrane protein